MLSSLEQAQNDVVAVIAEAAAEDVYAAWVTRIFLHADSYPDRAVPLEFQISQRAFGNLVIAAIGAVIRDAPVYEVAILRSG